MAHKKRGKGFSNKRQQDKVMRTLRLGESAEKKAETSYFKVSKAAMNTMLTANKAGKTGIGVRAFEHAVSARKPEGNMKVREHTSYELEGFGLMFDPVIDSVDIEDTPTGYTVKYITPDPDPENPRRAFDNLGHMAASHARYDLGDKDSGYKAKDYDSWADMKAAIMENEKPVAILPLYLYDHSGITISTHPFGDRWDSGQVGWIYATKEDVKKRGAPDDPKKIEEQLRGEVEEYDKYLTGDVYIIVKETFDKEKHEINYDVCGGYFGEKYAEEALKTEI